MRYNEVGWVDTPNVSDGLWACWVFNPSYPLCHFFLHSTISVAPAQAGAQCKAALCLFYIFLKIINVPLNQIFNYSHFDGD